MKQEKYNKQLQLSHRPTALIITVLALFVLLLSACSGNNNPNNTNSSATPVPTVNATTKNQAMTQLQTFQQWITLLKQNGGSTTQYQQQYDSDQQAVQKAHTTADYQAALNKLNGHVDAIKLPTLKLEAQNLQKQLSQQVNDWGKTHTYYDDYNQTTYHLGYEYGATGIGGMVQESMDQAQNPADYQQVVEDLQMYLHNWQAMKANAADKNPYNEIHQSDLDLIKYYDKSDKKVVVVSLQEQAMRVYDHGQLVRSLLVTTGRPDHPSLPGAWWVEGKQSPTVFKAGVPKSDPDWYPDTPIHYAMQYHSNGYFVHDSWWRVKYGPGTNFPHVDDSGDPFSAQGSHGCVNISQANAAWVYSFVQLYTSIIIY
ncbi:MAG: L,D-transpeptidase [Ktedonobacteraceae bacterium]|nr:L,D-transpeptidase [Ktedonobacteraceae bacterium]